MNCINLVHRSRNCDIHEHFCLIFGNIAIFTNSGTLMFKIILAKLNSCVKIVLIMALLSK